MSKDEKIEQLRVKASRRKLKIIALRRLVDERGERISRLAVENQRLAPIAAQVHATQQSLRDANARAATAEQQMLDLQGQRDRLVALADELGRRARISIDPASVIALDPVRWSDWLDERPQMPLPKEAA